MVVLVSETLGRVSGEGRQTLTVIGFGKLVWTYNANHRFWLSLLCLDYEKASCMSSFASTGTREGELKAQGPQPAFVLGSVTEKASGCTKLHGVGSQSVTR